MGRADGAEVSRADGAEACRADGAEAAVGGAVVLVVLVGSRFLLVCTTGPSTALACHGPALAWPGSARSFACGRDYEAVSHGKP